MARARMMHYHGVEDVEWNSGPKNRRLTKVLPGWAICTSGDRCLEIRACGQSTSIEADVTCKVCLRLLGHVNARKQRLIRERIDFGLIPTTGPGPTEWN